MRRSIILFTLISAIGCAAGFIAGRAQTGDSLIPASQIPARAEAINRKLRDFKRKYSSKSILAEIEPHVRGADKSFDDQIREVRGALSGTPTLLEIREQAYRWRAVNRENGAQLKKLEELIKKLTDDIESLKIDKSQLEASLNQITDPSTFEAVFERVGETIKDVDSTRTQLQEQLTGLILAQDRYLDYDLAIAGVLEEIEDTEKQFRGRLLTRDSPPLWEAFLQPPAQGSLQNVIRASFELGFVNTPQFVRARRYALLACLVLILVTPVLAYRLKRKFRENEIVGSLPPMIGEHSTVPTAFQILKRPVSLTLFIALIGMLALIAGAPMGAISLLGLLFLIPLLRLLPLLVNPAYRKLLYALSILYFLSELREAIKASDILERRLFALEAAIAIGVCVWLLRSPEMKRLVEEERRARWIVYAIRLGVALMSGSLIANIFGYFGLSQVLGDATLLSAYLAVILVTAVRIAAMVFWLFLRNRHVSALATVRLHRERIALWATRLFELAAFIIWLVAALELFTIRELLSDKISEIMSWRIEIGAIGFSISHVSTFLLILALGVVFAMLIKFVLKEELLSSVTLPRGVPNVISMIFYYLALFLVFVFALSAAGIELSKFTLLTGAFGVGIGFGLQNIFNNFVSGIILLIERPVYEGDVIEVSGITGEIRRIGIRSSTLRTFEGADVIIPNGDLIAGKVTNWTLSDQRRRITIPVGAAYGTTPQQVIDLLLDVARTDPRVVRDPEPMALFTGFGESSLNFELRFWAPDFSAYVQLRSDIAVAVEKAIRDAGIQVPFPQRDLHLRSVDENIKEALSGAQEEEKKTRNLRAAE